MNGNNKDLYKVSSEFRRKNFKRFVKTLFYLAVTCAAVFTILHFILFSVTASSVSMLPSIHEKERLFASPLKRDYKRGSLVVIKPLLYKNRRKIIESFIKALSLGRLPLVKERDMGNSLLVRRVIALPGDTVYMKDFVVYIKEKGSQYFLTEFELSKKKYDVTLSSLPEFWDNTIGSQGNVSEFTLKDGEYFVLGDNRNVVFDSRSWGVLTHKRIKAGVLFSL